MKRLTALILMTSLLALAGCSSMSASQRFQFTSNGYQATGNTLAGLIQTGVITNSNDLDNIQLVNNEVKVELDAWYEALVNDVPLDAQFVQRRVEALLGRLVQYQLNAERTQLNHGWNTSSDGDAVATDTSRGQRGEDDRDSERGRPGPDAIGTGHDQGPERCDARESGWGDREREELAASLRRTVSQYAELANARQ